MNRRRFLATGATATVVGVAGCLGGDGYETMEHERLGVEVPLAPIDDVYEWYDDGDTQIVDARSGDSFEDLRIADAVLSTHPDGVEDDPVDDWSTDERLVTYCVCPHAMAVSRAAHLIDDGYEEVYALDDGLEPWVEEGYPLEGDRVDDTNASLPSYHVEGEADPSAAGEYVTVSTLEGDRREMSIIGDDGSYELTLHFQGLDDDSLLEVETPDYTQELTLEELTSDVVRAYRSH